jgi:hypothetical protein
MNQGAGHIDNHRKSNERKQGQSILLEFQAGEFGEW